MNEALVLITAILCSVILTEWRSDLDYKVIYLLVQLLSVILKTKNAAIIDYFEYISTDCGKCLLTSVA